MYPFAEGMIIINRDYNKADGVHFSQGGVHSKMTVIRQKFDFRETNNPHRIAPMRAFFVFKEAYFRNCYAVLLTRLRPHHAGAEGFQKRPEAVLLIKAEGGNVAPADGEHHAGDTLLRQMRLQRSDQR